MTKNHDGGEGLTDRRRFIQKAGLLAAGSAIGGSLVGCASVDYTYIPCLGPATVPAPQPGMTYIRASQIGCALDCNLSDGSNKYKGGSATDDGPRINAAMAGASANHEITLIIDGSALISGLFLPAGGYWSIAGLGCGTGFYVKKGTNNDGIHNGPANAAIPFDPGPPAPPRGKNVFLSNFILNGNQGNGHDGNSTGGKISGDSEQWFCGINLMNLDNIGIEKVVVVNTPAYHFRLSNVGNVTASGCVMKSHGLSTDGLHFDGPANDISISNCDFTTGDDSIALNSPEGYSGNISRVAVTGCTFNSLSLMRLYTTYGSPIKDNIDTVSVSNCSGRLTEAAFLIGLSNGSNPNSVTSLAITDCSLTAPAILGIAENFGTITLTNVIFVPSQSDVVWVSPQPNRTCGFARPSPLYGGITSVGSSLSFENCRINRTSNVKITPLIVENDSTIIDLTFNGFGLQDAGSYPPLPELLNLGQGSIGHLILNAVDSSHIQSPVAAGGFSSIGSVSGAGVLATGWQFPNAVMANQVPYVSADSGMPSIKVNGVVLPYPEP